MKKPVKSDTEFENAVEPLVAAIKAPKLWDACRILFVSGESLMLSAELEQIGIVGLEVAEEGNVEGADFLISQSQLQLVKIGQEVLPKLLYTFHEPISEAAVGMASIQNDEERQSIFAAKIMAKVKSQEKTSELSKSFTRYIGAAIKPFGELLVGGLYKFYYERHNTQRQLITEFSETVTSLKRVGLLAPFLSLALCPACNNYELAFSRSVKFSRSCTQCGSDWPVLIINEFPQPFATLKRLNRDLPVFISAYLRSKSPLPVEVFPNAEFDLEGGKKVEADVFIPGTATGIECKCYANNIAVSDAAINSEAGKIKQQIENYLRLGLTRILVFTNYNEIDAGKLNARLREQLTDVRGLEELKVASADITKFVKLLDEEAVRLSDAVDRRWQRELEHRLEKQLEQGKAENTP